MVVNQMGNQVLLNYLRYRPVKATLVDIIPIVKSKNSIRSVEEILDNKKNNLMIRATFRKVRFTIPYNV